MSKLKDLCLNITDGEHGTVIDDTEGEYFLLSNKNIIDGNIYIGDNERKINKATFEKINKRTRLEQGDLLISTVGTIGKTAVICDEINYVFQRSVGIIKVDKNKINPFYLKYQLDNKEFQKRMIKLSKGAIQKCLYISDLGNLDIKLVAMELQNKIVNVLKKLDDKIQNNNKTILELESMAKTIYDYWFLQYEFPNKEGKPYKLSGGKMVYNEELKKEIPEGWTVKNLSELATFNNGINYDKDEIGDKDYKIINVRNISSSSLLINDSELDDITLKKLQGDKYLVEPNDIIIARSGTPGAVRLLLTDLQDIIYCGFIIKCKPNKSAHRLLITYYLKMLEGSNATKTGGSIMQNVSQDTLKQVKICLPTEQVISDFNNKISTMLKQIQSSIQENQELTKLRDELLPLLMNGQVGLKE